MTIDIEINGYGRLPAVAIAFETSFHLHRLPFPGNGIFVAGDFQGENVALSSARSSETEPE